MTEWFSVVDAAEQERLLLAWPDAPLGNLDLCAMILETAREQVEAFAPALPAVVPIAAGVDDVDGWQLRLAKAGQLVTFTANVELPGDEATAVVELPAAYLPVDVLPAYTTPDGAVQLTFDVDGSLVLDRMPWAVEHGDERQLVLVWLADGVTTGVPMRWVYAQLQQSKNLYNAGRAGDEGAVGPGEFSFVPRPLDKTIRAIIRPIDGKPHVL